MANETQPSSVSALTRPPRLRAGDRVAVVSPSGPIPEENLRAGVAVLRDEHRAQDLQEAWCDPAVRAVFCARGGYGAQRMTDLLDWAAMRSAGPKVFVGYSDITVLHEAFATQLGLVTLHGPMPATNVFARERDALERLRRTLFEPESMLELTGPRAATLIPGRAEGITLGGCVSLLADDLGSPTARRGGAGGLLLIEDIGEKPYRLDRCLTQLRNAGWLNGVRGVATGSWSDSDPYPELRKVLLDRLAPLGVPVVEELGFGHGPDPLTLALGVPAVLDADRATLRYTQPVLR